ncbi:MAG: hypothetical protein ACK5L3_12370 [Oscillospiraceae bacterium]
MLKIVKYLKVKEWVMVGCSIVFIVAQVFLDLKLPDYMAQITLLVQTEGSAMGEVVAAGAMMLLCALGSLAAACIVGFFAAKVAALLGARLREGTFDKVLSFSAAETN